MQATWDILEKREQQVTRETPELRVQKQDWFRWKHGCNGALCPLIRDGVVDSSKK
jgi:hypothetical protein